MTGEKIGGTGSALRMDEQEGGGGGAGGEVVTARYSPGVIMQWEPAAKEVEGVAKGIERIGGMDRLRLAIEVMLLLSIYQEVGMVGMFGQGEEADGVVRWYMTWYMTSNGLRFTDANMKSDVYSNRKGSG